MNDTSSDRPQNPEEIGPDQQDETRPAPQDPVAGTAADAPLPEGPEGAASTAGPAEAPMSDDAAAGAEDEPELDEDAPVPAEFFRIDGERSRAAAVDAARRELARHEVVVMPTDTVYGIAANAFSPRAVQRLLEAKGRDRTMPPPVLIAHTGVMDGLADALSEETRALAGAFWPGGLTLICHAQPSLQWDLGETRGTVALRVPDDAVAQALLQETGPLAVSSANRTGMPAAVTAEQAQGMLGDSVRVYLEDGPRTEGMDPAPTGDGPAPVSSTIVDCTGRVPVVVRHGRISLTRLREVVPSVISRDGTEEPADTVSQTGEEPVDDAAAAGDRTEGQDAGVQDASAQDIEAQELGDREPGESVDAEHGEGSGAGTPGPGGDGSGGGSTVADPEIGIVERARAEQEETADAGDFAAASTAGLSAASAVVAVSARDRRAKAPAAPDQDRTRPAAPSSEATRPLGLAQASALVAHSAPDSQDADDDWPLPETGIDQKR